jgi:chromosome partitioning protein
MEHQENKIVLFANQKGGVGKTTLCGLFANYLSVDKKVPLLVVDADPQQTFSSRRKDDLCRHADVHYNVQSITIKSPESTHTIMKNLRTLPGTTIIDTPGSLTQDGMLQLLINADYIVCPYHYDLNTIDSTRAFILTVFRLRQSHPQIKTQFIFVCNKHDVRVGKGSELKAWKIVDEYFKKFGILAPRIGNYADLERYNTISNSDKVAKLAKHCFDFIFKTIYNIEDND